MTWWEEDSGDDGLCHCEARCIIETRAQSALDCALQQSDRKRMASRIRASLLRDVGQRPRSPAGPSRRSASRHPSPQRTHHAIHVATDGAPGHKYVHISIATSHAFHSPIDFCLPSDRLLLNAVRKGLSVWGARIVQKVVSPSSRSTGSTGPLRQWRKAWIGVTAPAWRAAARATSRQTPIPSWRRRTRPCCLMPPAWC